MNVYFGDKSYYDLERRGGLLYVTLKMIYASSPTQGRNIEFVLDTGAYMTVISRGTAIRCGLDKLHKTFATLFGFGGGIDVDFIRIPGLSILGKLHTDVPVLVPHDLYRIHEKTGEKKQMPDVLGLNVLEYYNYYIDTENDKLYLQENPSPRFSNKELASGQAFLTNTALLSE